MIVEQKSSTVLKWIALLGIGVCLLVTLFVIKTNALAAHKQELALRKALERENQEIKILKAEIAYLESPERIARLAKDHLDLVVTPPEKTVSLDDLNGQNTPPEAPKARGR